MSRHDVTRFFGVLALAILLAGGAVLTYYPATANGFVWDTLKYLYQHPFYLSSLGPDHLIWMFTSFDNSNWHPLTWLSWAIDYRIYGGLDAWGYHFTNIVLHGLNCALLFILILAVFGTLRPDNGGYPLRTDKAALTAAWLAAALFAVHPQHVESVVWVAERKDLLCQAFMLLSLLAYFGYALLPAQRKQRWFILSLSLFLLAALSKPMAVTFPLVLLLLDVYPLGRSTLAAPLTRASLQRPLLSLAQEKLPFLLLSAFLVVMTLTAQQGAISSIPIGYRALNAFNSVIFYLGKLLVPLDLSPHYAYFRNPGQSLGWHAFAPLLGFIAISVGCAIAWFRGRHAWLVAWLFYLVTLSPVLGIIQVGQQGAADRYTYFPTLPAYLLAGAGLLKLLEKRTAATRWLLVITVLCVIGLLAAETREQIKVWKDPLSLWQYTAKKSSSSRLAQFNLGIIYFNNGNFEGAAEQFEKAHRLAPNPDKDKVLAWLGIADLKLNRYKEALAVHTRLSRAGARASELGLDQNCVQYNLGWLSAKLDMPGQSRQHFRRVEAGSELSLNADTWLNWLQKHPQTDNASDKTGMGLPPYCQALIPAITGNPWVNMLNEARQ